MHVVTKFLVVLAAILSVLLSGLAVASTANYGRVRSAFDASEARLAGLETGYMSERARLESLKRDAEAERDAFRNERDALNQQLASLQQELETLTAENSLLALSQTQYQAQIDEAIGTVQSLISLEEQSRSELSDLRSRDRDSQRRLTQLDTRLQDVQSENEVLSETNRALEERIAELNSRGSGSNVRATVTGPGTPPPGLRARVTDVRVDSFGDQIVGIDAGSSDGLRAGMELTIARGKDFVGTLKLTRVDINESLGRVTLKASGSSSVRSGDSIITITR